MQDLHPGMIRVRRAALFAALSSMLWASPALAGDDAAKVAWRQDLGQAQAEAKSRNLLLWIQFTGPWCGNCRRMEHSTFVHPSVVAESVQRFVPVKLRSDEYEALAQNLGLSVLPSTVIIRPNGEVIEKLEGYADPAEFSTFLTTVLTAEGRSPEQVAARTRSRVDKDPSVALAGYDPVSLLTDQKLVPGRPELTVEHNGRSFRFANEAGRDAFLKKPDSFAPVNDGRCPVSQVDHGDFQSGDPHWGVVYNGHLYLFKDASERDRFAKDPERYAGVDRLARTSTCPHCRQHPTLARRVSNRFSTMFASQSLTASTIPLSPVGTTPAATSLTDRMTALLSLDSVIRR